MLHLTRQEREVILFLATVALAGMGVNFLVKMNSGAKIIANIYQETVRVDINSADKDLLMSISGIGAKLAERIIEYRQEHGGVRESAELKNIKGINAYKYEKIKDSLQVD